MSDSYTVYFNGQQFGPHTQAEITSMLADGSIDASASVYHASWADWQPISSVIRTVAVAQPVPAPAYAAPTGGGGFDELTTLAQDDAPAPRSAPARKKPKPKSKRNLYIGLGVGGGVLMLIIIIAMVMLSGPGITIQPHNAHNFFFYWQITNDAHSGLTIDRVVYNGEHVARLANVASMTNPRQSETTGPVTLGADDTQAFFEHSDQGYGPEYYLKKVTFIDVYTSRGNYRWYVDSGFSSEQPAFDEAKAKASDEEMDAESKKLDDGRRGPVKLFD